jgi:hypothetical protein
MPLITTVASVVPVSLPSPATPGEYRLLLQATAGPLPSFSLEGPVSVKEGAEKAAEPVPVRLYDYSLDRDRYAPGDTLRLTLRWEALDRLVEDYSISVKLLDVDGAVLAQQDSGPQGGQHPTSRWRPGERIADQHELKIPSGTPLGRYQLQVIFYRPTDLSRLLTLDEEGLPVEETLSTWVKAKPPLEPGQLSIQHPLQVNLGDQVTLLGYDVSPETVQPGQTLDLTLYWQARQPMTEDYTVFTHLVAADGRIVAQQDNQPAEGRYPTSIWDAGEIVADRYRLTIAPDAPGSEYHLEVGMYFLSTLERLKVASGDEEGQDRIWLDLVLKVHYPTNTATSTPFPTLTLTSSPTGTPLPTNTATLATMPIPTLTPTSTPTTNSPLPDFPLNLGNTWVYSATHYDTYETERITATYIITETVVDTQLHEPYFVANIVRDKKVVTLSDNLVGKDWEQHYLGGGDGSISFWYVISGTQVYEQRELDWSEIETSEAILQYIFPLSSSVLWYPDPWQRKEFPNLEVTSGLRRADGPIEIKVPAGTFRDCFEVITMYNSGATFSTFCAGIGVVGSHYDHVGTPFGFRTILIDYSLVATTTATAETTPPTQKPASQQAER